MENQHKKIKGYRDLSQQEIDDMNELKQKGEEIRIIIEKLETIAENDHRWLAIGKTDIQKGFMAVIRSIAQPTTF